MRKPKIAFAMAALVCLGVFFSAEPSQAAAKTKITLLKSIDKMEQGSSYTFKAKVKNSKAKNIIWKSSDKSVLDVSSSGEVKAKTAGLATVTAKVGKVSVTETVMVYPSLSEISKKNETAANLDAGVYSSVVIREKGEKEPGYVRAVAKDGNGYMTVSSGMGLQVCKGNLKYSYDREEGIVSIYSSHAVTSGGILPGYTMFSNEKIMAVSEEGDAYRISTETDIAGLTKEEQENRTGITDGIIQQELLVNKKTGLLKELIYTILFDKEDPDFKYVSHEVFSYNEEIEPLVPQVINIVLRAEHTRTVTIVSAPGTEKEEKEVYTLPDTMPLYVPADIIYYKDAACTQEADPVEKHKDGTYDSSLVYIK